MSFAVGQMGGHGAPTLVVKKDVSLAQSAGTYDIFTATGGDVLIASITPYMVTAAAGLTSIQVQTNDTTAVSIIGSTLLVNLLVSGAVINTSWNQAQPLLLISGNKIRIQIVGTGSAGLLRLAVLYRPVDAGASLA